jgi:hypothetical protein
MHIPRLEQRIKSMIFRRRFEMEVEEIRPVRKTALFSLILLIQVLGINSIKSIYFGS